MQAQLAEQKAETEASVSRSMQLIDRIMKDKDALSGTARYCMLLLACCLTAQHQLPQ